MSPARQFALLILLASVAVLGAALLFEHVGGLAPCTLCLYERWPWEATIALSMVALLAGDRASTPWVIALCGVIFLAGAGLGFYHAGVEQKWFAGPTSCSGSFGTADTVEALKAQIMGQKPVRCDEIPWSMLGISMAGWNAILSLVMAVFALSAVPRLRPRP